MALVAVVRTHFLSHIVFVFCVLLTAAGRHKRKILLQLLLATEISQTSESSRRAGLCLFRATARILFGLVRSMGMKSPCLMTVKKNVGRKKRKGKHWHVYLLRLS